MPRMWVRIPFHSNHQYVMVCWSFTQNELALESSAIPATAWLMLLLLQTRQVIQFVEIAACRELASEGPHTKTNSNTGDESHVLIEPLPRYRRTVFCVPVSTVGRPGAQGRVSSHCPPVTRPSFSLSVWLSLLYETRFVGWLVGLVTL